MKIRLSLINVSLIIFIIGILCTVGVGMQAGAMMVLAASVTMLAGYLIQIIQSIKQKKLWSFDNILYTIAILVFAVIFIHGFSISIGMPLLGNMPIFSSVYLISGLFLILLFLVGSIRLVNKLGDRKKQILLITILSIGSGASALGLLGMARILSFSGWFITYSLIFLTAFYLIFFTVLFFLADKSHKTESLILAMLSGGMIIFLIVRFYFPYLMPQGLTNSVISFGFVPAIILPLSILYTKRFPFFIVFILYFISLDVYLIHTDRNFNYLVTVGADGCVGFENATTYPTNNDPGISMEELLKEPSENELNHILAQWKDKDFTPKQIQIEYENELPNGDSLKVVSHLVYGQKHYGLIRIPKGINISKAPILLSLMGGGTGMDVLKTSDINQLSSGTCSELLDNYISIMPSFRGNILRGEDFCFRSEGYSGDVWMGPAEDAVAFLEVIKLMYGKTENTQTLAKGISRGATVALIIGGLTDKLDYIIASSTHTKFVDRHVVDNELVGGSYPRAFYTPKSSPEEIRKRLITSSPYYFADRFPAFEVHQGTKDQKTTIWHAKMLQKRLEELGRNDRTDHIYIYDDQGHAYEDEDTVCASLSRFLEK